MEPTALTVGRKIFEQRIIALARAMAEEHAALRSYYRDEYGEQAGDAAAAVFVHEAVSRAGRMGGEWGWDEPSFVALVVPR